MDIPTPAECGRCGDCCDPVHLGPQAAARLEEFAGTVDPRLNPEAWRAAGWEHPAQAVTNWLNGQWFAELELAVDDYGQTVGYVCPRFDPIARLCTAHDDRPPICREFPSYGDQPGRHVMDPRLIRCTYWADYAPTERPADWAPVDFRPRNED